MDKKWKDAQSDGHASQASTRILKSASALSVTISPNRGDGIAPPDAHRSPKFPTANPTNAMSAGRRELMVRVLGGFRSEEAVVFLWHFDRLSACDIMLKWLIVNGFTGRTFHEWILFNKFTPLACAKFICAHIRPQEN